jgi:hypothetical protein
MAKNVRKIAELLGAEVVAEVPETGGGAFGAARLDQVISALQARLQPGQGKRPGRPRDPSWQRAPKVPMSVETEQTLIELAEQASRSGRRVSPMQLAAQLLEEAVSRLKPGNGDDAAMAGRSP